MKQEHQVLWEKIQQLELDDPAAAFPFSAKLARENKWTIPFTRLAIAEYKKFLLLCCISPRGASPSQVVDTVWHLHLTYTRSYWDELCGRVINRQLHHHPSTGGTDENKKHRDWYKETLELYTEVFAASPPAEVWPATIETVLSALASDYRISTRITPAIQVAIGLVVILFIFITQLRFGVLNLYLLKGPAFLEFMFILFLHSIGITILLLSCKWYGFRKLIYRYSPATYMHYGMIEAIYGEARALQTAIVELVNNQLLELTPSKKFISHVTGDSLSPTNNPLLQALARQTQDKKLQAITNPDDELSYADLEQLYHHNRPGAPEFSNIKWLSCQKFSWRWVPYRFVLVIFVIRLIQGMYHHHPVGYLLSGMFLFTIGYAIIIFCFRAEDIVKQGLIKKMEEGLASQPNLAPADQLAIDFGYRGTTALAGVESYALLAGIFVMLPDSAKPAAKEGGGEHGSGGCGGAGGGCGGSCGGGCGGCGGGCGG